MTESTTTGESHAPPVFLVGSVRSGTTMLRLMLDHHPRIRWFGEFEYAFLGCGDSSWPAAADYRRLLATDRMFRQYGLEIPDDARMSHADLVRHFLDRHRARGRSEGKDLVGCTVHSRFDLIPAIWPDSRFIHLLRDPRDVARSCVGMGWVGNCYHGAEYWLAAEQRWSRLRDAVDRSRWIEVRYEALIADPVCDLKAICAFLGVDYDDAMLRYHERSTYDGPDPRRAEQWRRKMSSRAVRHVEYRVGTLLEDRGFVASGLPRLDVGPMEKLWLRVHHRVRRAMSSIRALGFPLWLSSAVSKRIGPRRWRDAVALRVNEAEIRALK